MSNGRKIHQFKQQEMGVQVCRALLPNSGHMVTMLSADAGAKPTNEVASDTESSEAYQKWGSSNDAPVVNRQKIEASSTAFPLIVRLVELMYGKGLTYYTEERTADGITTNWASIAAVDTFLEENDIDGLMLERLMDFKFHNNLFCEFILAEGLNSITNIYHLEAEFSRKGEISGARVKNLKYRADWSKSDGEQVIPYVSRREAYSKEDILKFAKAKKKFAMHHHFPSPGRTLYAKPPHAALLDKDGWLDYANSIPKIMNLINQNANAIKFHIEIPGNYWSATHPKYDTMTKEEQDKLRDEKLTEMDEWFKGSNGAHDTFISHFAVDHTGKYLSGWKITPINAKAQQNAFLTSLQEADTQITRGIGMDVSLAGIQPAGGKMGAGSGSDKRTAFTNAVSMSHAAMKVILDPLYVVARYNGWPKNIKFAFLHDVPTTLNDQPSGVKPVEP